MWRCVANALPVATALRSRAIDVDPMCRRCGASEETVEHAIRDCNWTEFLWAVSPLRIQPVIQDEFCSIVDWFESIRRCPQQETHAAFATLAWAAWFARNLYLFQQKELSHVECIQIAQRARWSPSVTSQSKQKRALKVECTRTGQVKISSDAALGGGQFIGIGAVLTEASGSVLGCRFGVCTGVFKVVEGEAIAMLEGLNLCRERGVEDIIAEKDNQELYWLLVQKETDLSYLGDTLQKIHDLKASFRCACFSWTPREGNSNADRLAAFAFSNPKPMSSVMAFPYDVNNSISL
ncbi:uncharacterized protein LOC130993832 [Salvia miltiorrhiza]|uniref:uncharacterized protein LOC130993832 n=1 Tax=Salvia miltiorrhiza TaxID=226208 RepID=UPI0025ABF22F|nr:uncharacterized protein LOC130993832 [Salvia miltiorrhiza]